jgi:hypothetical protein
VMKTAIALLVKKQNHPTARMITDGGSLVDAKEVSTDEKDEEAKDDV